ncbi:hypothetical protein QE436_000044 [Pantoea anthophila]|nr:hypothetical protein [Pantoea anthophila]
MVSQQRALHIISAAAAAMIRATLRSAFLTTRKLTP